MFDKLYGLIRSLFSTAYISVVSEQNDCTVRVKVLKSGEIKESEIKHFKTFGGELPPEAIKHIKKFTKEYRFCYISTPLASINQGALPTCSKESFKSFAIDPQIINSLCIEKSWSVYAYPDDISMSDDSFAQVGGVDFLFSPFAIIYSTIKNEQSNEKKLYILAQKGSVALAIMDTKMLYYGAYFIFAPSESLRAEDDSTEHLELPESLASEIEELTPLGDEMESIGALESLDGDVKLDEFQDTHGDGDSSVDYEKANASIEEFAKGMDILNFIKESMSDFYKNPNYDGSFVDEVLFLDGFGLGKDVIEYIQNTLLINISQRKIDIADTVCSMAINEVEGAK